MRKNRFNSLDIVQQAPGRFAVSGNLTFSSIDKDTVKSFPFLQGPGAITLDFSDVGKTDSAGLALIVEWIKFARRRQIPLLFENIPGQLLTLAKLSGFGQLLQASTTPNPGTILFLKCNRKTHG
jgi:phospholipid transport system transporter-binding protein